MRLLGWATVALLTGALCAPATASGSTATGTDLAGTDLAASDFDDLVKGRTHELRFRPVLAAVKPMRKTPRRAAVREAAAAVTACDAAVVSTLRTVPTTDRKHDETASCVVLGQRETSDARFLLGPSEIDGSAVDSSRPLRQSRKRAEGTTRYAVGIRFNDTGLAAFNAFAARHLHKQVAIVLDGSVISSPTIQPEEDAYVALDASLEILPNGRTTDEGTASELTALISRSKLEELSTFATQTSMTDAARRIFADARPQVDDRTVFSEDCPTPESTNLLVLGCYDGRIFISRVERADLAPVMRVTAAHEMLHAAYESLSRRERTSIDAQLDEFFDTSADKSLRDVIAGYEETEPGARLNELHSLVPTQVAELPPRLERYYRRYFRDRARVVDAFLSYRRVFDDLKAQADRLDQEIKALVAFLDGLDPQIDAADAEASRLTQEIDSLRSQGRIEESNRLVGAQNAAIDRVRSLIDQYNRAVDEHNAKIKEADFIAVVVNVLYDSLEPIE